MSISCDYPGIITWVTAMNWSGQQDFETASLVEFLVDGKEAGLLKNHGPLTFLMVSVYVYINSICIYLIRSYFDFLRSIFHQSGE